MSINKYRPHVWVIPEDDANRQIAIGFLQYHAVDFMVVGVNEPAGGWERAFEILDKEFAQYLRNHADAYLILLIDFDEKFGTRFGQCGKRIPEDLSTRVFVIGSRHEPESLKADWKMPYEQIGAALAQDCITTGLGRWSHPHLVHNLAELQRMLPIIRPIIFPGT